MTGGNLARRRAQVRVDKCVLVSSNGTHGTKNIIGNGIKEFSAKPTPTLQPNTCGAPRPATADRGARAPFGAQCGGHCQSRQIL